MAVYRGVGVQSFSNALWHLTKKAAVLPEGL